MLKNPQRYRHLEEFNAYRRLRDRLIAMDLAPDVAHEAAKLAMIRARTRIRWSEWTEDSPPIDSPRFAFWLAQQVKAGCTSIPGTHGLNNTPTNRKVALKYTRERFVR